MRQALLLLGSNIDRFENMPTALQRLKNEPAITVQAVSDFYESEDISGKYPTFLNAAVWIQTKLDAAALRKCLRGIEAEMGRVRTADRFAPRTIDMDISLYSECYDNECYDNECHDGLIATIESTEIPDPDIYRYAHVTIPLAQIRPDWRHPKTGERLSAIAEQLDSSTLKHLPLTTAL